MLAPDARFSVCKDTNSSSPRKIFPTFLSFFVRSVYYYRVRTGIYTLYLPTYLKNFQKKFAGLEKSATFALALRTRRDSSVG